jgi:UDP-3-O-[3-hydroxymyristoyl] glucosamine N-acyltransferase
MWGLLSVTLALAGPAVVHPSAVVHPTATLGADVVIGAGAVVGPDVTVGDGAEIAPRAVVNGTLGTPTILGAGVRVGRRATVGAGAELGDGVDVAADVVIGAGADIGASSVIAYGATLGPGALLADHVVIGNLAQIGSSASPRTTIGASSSVGRGVVVSGDLQAGAGVVIAAGVSMGSGVRLGSDVTVRAGSILGDRVEVGAFAVVGRSGHLESDAEVGASAVLRANVTVQSFGVVDDGEVIPRGAVVPGADASTVLLLHFDSDYGDASPTGASPSIGCGGAVSLNTSGVGGKFGGYANFGGGCLSFPAHANFNFGTSDFTIDFWMQGNPAIPYQQIFNMGGDFHLEIELGEPTGHLAFSVSENGSSWLNGGFGSHGDVSAALTPAWHHVALVRSGTLFTLYLDGQTVSSFVSAAPMVNAGYVMLANGFGGRVFYGNLDEVKVSRSARFSGASFTPPTAPYSN